MKIQNTKFNTYLLLHVAFILYSFTTVCSKFAAQEDVFSLPFFAWYASGIIFLGIYAVIWQQVLNKLPLTTAYSSKGVVLIYGFLLGSLLFGEVIKVQTIIGAIIVLIGIYLVVTSK